MIFRRIQSSLSSPWQRTLYILFLAQLMTGVGFSSIFPFLPLYVKSLGSSHGFNLDLLAGLVFSGQAFTMMLASPFWGALADRYGRKLMVERSMFGGAFILGLMAFARTAEELVILRAIQGLITGTIAATNALAAASSPRENSGFAMGMMQVGMGAGVALGPMLGGAIADAHGYSAAFYVPAVLLLLAGLTVTIGIKEPPDPSRTNPGPGTNEKKQIGFLQGWKKVLSCPGVPATYGLSFLNNLCRNMMLPVVPIFISMLMQGTGLVNTFTGLITGTGSAAATLSGIYLGRLGDRIGQLRILVTGLIVGGILFSLQSLVSAGWQLLILQAILGIAMGGITPSISALLARFTKPGTEGAVYGLDNSIGSGARSLAPLIGSTIMLWSGPRATFLVTGIMFILTAGIALLSLPRQPNPCQEESSFASL